MLVAQAVYTGIHEIGGKGGYFPARTDSPTGRTGSQRAAQPEA